MIKNLTPHIVNVGNDAFNPSGEVARVSESSEFTGLFEGVELVQKTFGQVTGLPEEEPGTLLIVSMAVRLALPGRKDLASPGDQIRDESGKIIGCRNLVVNG